MAGLACILLLLATTSAADAAGPADEATLRVVDAYLATERSATGVPGLALVIVNGDRIVHLATLGAADGTGRPVTPQTPFLIASLSKGITAIAVMQLVEAGRLDLDAPVQRYLPWFTVADPAAGARITVRELLAHTSGLDPALDTVTLYDDDQGVGALERAVRRFASSELVAPPGAGYHYANANYDTLGLIVEWVAGQPFSDYVEQHVFGPLDMRHSHATLAGAVSDGAAAGYQRWLGLAWLPTGAPISRASAPSGMLFASAEDLGHDLIAQLNGGTYGTSRVLSASGMAALQTPSARMDESEAYAMGWWTRPLAQALDPTHPTATRPDGGPLLIEHTGHWNNANAYIGFVPAQGWGMALLLNANDRSSASRLDLISQNVLRILGGASTLPWVPTEAPLIRYSVLAALALLLVALASLVWSVRVLSGRRRGGGRERHPRRLRLAAVIALGLDALVVGSVVVVVLTEFDGSVDALLRGHPDLGLLIVPAVLLAAVWGPVRTVLLARRLQLWAASSSGRGGPAGPAS